ncbi:MAG: DNA translocase FtsK, partial [Gammaproteobacteria bacterium]
MRKHSKSASKASALKTSPSLQVMNRVREGTLILSFVLAIFLLIALLSYQHTDAIWVVTKQSSDMTNWGGKVGAWCSTMLLYSFGYFAYIFPFIVGYSGWIAFKGREQAEIDRHALALHIIGFFVTLISGSGLAYLVLAPPAVYLNVTAGGVLGDFIGYQVAAVLSPFGATLIMFGLLLVGVMLLTGLSWLKALDRLGRWSFRLTQWSITYMRDRRIRRAARQVNHPARPVVEPMMMRQIESPPNIRIPAPRTPVINSSPKRQIKLFEDIEHDGTLPSLSLLDPPEPHRAGVGYSNETLEEMSREVETRLQDFGIDVQVVAVHPGPVITRFEMQLAPGVKVSRITALAKDLARSLSTISVRIVEVIPGKSVVGLELPNEHREIVRLSEVLSSQQYEQAHSPLSLALGKDIAGHPVIVDLAKMPHLLVAGTTGSGKSVGLNAMLLSLLYKSGPDEVRMIMIDPKMLELSIYEGIPHLLAPVVVDMKEAANALRWCVVEMDRRYKLMAALGVRNLASYNAKVKEAQEKGKPIKDPLWKPGMSSEPDALGTLPYIVVLVDEFADMIMVVGKKVEELIARIAQKARAAGIHMILATQRPSVDVITGLIKANVPTRIAFQVSSKIDSRTILDQQGAEQLLGHGDMLYLAPGTGVPVRVHGAFVADHEVHHVVSDWKRRGEPNYITAIVEDESEAGEEGMDGQSNEGLDPLYDQAVQIVIDSRRASISN